MTEERLEFASIIKSRVDKLDEEINALVDITPEIRSSELFSCKRKRGTLCSIIRNRLKNKNYNSEYEIELSNEDCRALIAIRLAEIEALKSVIKEL